MTVNPTQVYQQLQDFEKSHNTVLIDVRERNELIEDGSMPGFLNVPLSKLQPRHFSQDSKFILTCRSGNRAKKAVDVAKGFKVAQEKLVVMEGGIIEWKKLNYPTTNTPSPFVHLFFEEETSTCCFIVVDEESLECCIIDPVLDYNLSSGQVNTVFADKVFDFVKANNLRVKYLMETHVHADHITASAYLKSRLENNPPICIGNGIEKVQEVMRKLLEFSETEVNTSHFDKLWVDNEEFSLGSIPAKVIATPGHTPDSVTYLIGDCLFCGDSIFYPDVGGARCDFPNGSASELYDSVQKLYGFSPTFKIFAGHDYPPQTRSTAFFSTVDQEARMNKLMNREINKDTFVDFRGKRDSMLGAPKLLYPSLNFNLKAGRPPISGFVKTPIKMTMALKELITRL